MRKLRDREEVARYDKWYRLEYGGGDDYKQKASVPERMQQKLEDQFSAPTKAG